MVRQLPYVAYVPTSPFLDAHMILDMQDLISL